MATPTASPNSVRALFDLPTEIHKGEFVLKLSEGIERPEKTAADYVVTPALADAFNRALGLVGGAIADGRSRAGYLHGSFGSGKSHFMALLSLLLDGHEAAWKIPELHALRAKHAFVGSRKLLKLHFHMLGHANIEQAIYSGYLEYCRRHHAEAPIPPVFADEQLFADALRMLDELGDDAFFGPMNAETPAVSGWGSYATEALWNRERFEQSSSSTDPKQRAALFDSLVRTRFRAYATESRAFIDLDSGLAVIARHAHSLGYDAIILFLDELILWLAHRASEVAWLHNEVQKMVKLVEAQDASRQIPIVSFIARQRSLVEMVGKEYAGAESVRLNDSLKHWEGRYDTLLLEDRNLPLIVEKRLLRPRDAEAKKTLDQSFDRMKQSAGASWQTMLGTEDAQAFRRLYPFSPALVEALVALSNSLQRERTALKLLLELLIEHCDDLEMGEVVRVGDLFDVLAGGEEPTDGVMKARFEAAKQLYRYQLLPVIQEQNGTRGPERCQRERPGHPTRIGCSNCRERQCRADNRVAKTLLIAALVPEVASLKNLTASRLVQLNHGTLKVPIPGTEASEVARRLRLLASVVGQVHIDAGSDPAVRVQLEGVDLGPILDQARDADTDGAKQRVIRDLLFEALGIEKILDWGKDITVEWRNTKRLGHVRFGNVRTMSSDILRCGDAHDFRLIVDYPFDKEAHGPHEDLEVIERFIEESQSTWTLVWLPHFFSSSMNKLLGELVILEHILESRDGARKYVSHLTFENQGRALNDLENLRNQKKRRIELALQQAYGVAQEREGDLDSAQRVDRHLLVLKPGVDIKANLAANLSEALNGYIPALLDARYPRHPRFTVGLTKQRVERLLDTFGRLVDEQDKRITTDRDLVSEVSGTLGELGLVRVSEGTIHLVEDRLLQELENTRQRLAEDQPTVGELRHWIDESGKIGLLPIALDLVIRCYARWSARTFVQFGRPFEPKAGQTMPDDIVLEKPDLPEQADWQKALGIGAALFGIPGSGRARHADNLKAFEQQVFDKLKGVSAPASLLCQKLVQRMSELGAPTETDRLTTARSAAELCARLQGKRGVDQVRELANFIPQKSAAAVSQSLLSAVKNGGLLDNRVVFGVFLQLASRKAVLPGAAELLDQVASALRQDEVNVALEPELQKLAQQAIELQQPPAQATEAGPSGLALFEKKLVLKGKEVVHGQLQQLVAQAESHVQVASDQVEVTVEIRVIDRK